MITKRDITFLSDSALKRLSELQGDGDEEINHKLADKVLCDVLASLGMRNVVDAWEAVEKWYA